MAMVHPFDLIKSKSENVTLGALILTVTLLIVMAIIDQPLSTVDAPLGIISFEFARTTAKAASIVSSWSIAEQQLAAFAIGLDYLLILCYAIAIPAAILWIADKMQFSDGHLTAAMTTSWGVLFAALLDTVENIALIVTLTGSNSLILAPLAFWCALVKFILLILTSLVVSYCVITCVLRNRAQSLDSR